MAIYPKVRITIREIIRESPLQLVKNSKLVRKAIARLPKLAEIIKVLKGRSLYFPLKDLRMK